MSAIKVQLYYIHTAHYRDQMNGSCTVSYHVGRRDAIPRPPELRPVKFLWMWPTFPRPYCRVLGSSTELYHKKIGVKHGLWEWYMLSIIPKPKYPQQVHIGWPGLRCSIPSLHDSSNNGVLHNLLVQRGYRTMHFILSLNIDPRLNS